jgi:hypothetical protein
MNFFKTVIQIEILSEGGPVDDLSLKEIAHEIYEGECVGTFEIVSVKEISGKECADGLHEMGSEPDFFCLDDDGNSTTEDH